jgi:hypothetical protein
MRAREFLLEYNRTKTSQVFGNKLIKALAADYLPTATLRPFATYLQQKRKIGSEVDDQEKIQLILDHIMQMLESADPTPNKQYVQWLAKVYANERESMEDLISVGRDWLETYHVMKSKRILPAEANNIMNLRFGQLQTYTQDNELLNKLQSAEEAKVNKGIASTVFENDQVRIIVPHDQPAACYYGQGTRWCTAARSNNRFDGYDSQGPLYILLPKQPEYEGEKYQLHFPSGQFMDEGDDEVDSISKLLTERFGDLVTFFREREPEINDLVMFAPREIVYPIIGKILTAVQDKMWEDISDWELQDDYWYDWLSKNGYAYPEGHEDEGSIDWDKVAEDNIDYASWNDDVRDYISDVTKAVDLDIDTIRDLALEWDGQHTRLGELERIVALNLENKSKRSRNSFNQIISFLTDDIHIGKENGEWKVYVLGRMGENNKRSRYEITNWGNTDK